MTDKLQAMEERILELEEKIADMKIWAKGTNMNYEHWYKGRKSVELDEHGEPKGWFKQSPDCDYDDDEDCHPDDRCCNPCLSLNGYDVISDEEWEKIRQRRNEQ